MRIPRPRFDAFAGPRPPENQNEDDRICVEAKKKKKLKKIK